MKLVEKFPDLNLYNPQKENKVKVLVNYDKALNTSNAKGKWNLNSKQNPDKNSKK